MAIQGMFNFHPCFFFLSLFIDGLHKTGIAHTRLCRWMVYSRATTSAMALRPALPDAGFLVFVSLGIAICFYSGKVKEVNEVLIHAWCADFFYIIFMYSLKIESKEMTV